MTQSISDADGPVPGDDDGDSDGDDSIAAAARLTISDGNKENKDKEEDGKGKKKGNYAERRGNASDCRSALNFEWQKEKRNGKDFKDNFMSHAIKYNAAVNKDVIATVGPRISAEDGNEEKHPKRKGIASNLGAANIFQRQTGDKIHPKVSNGQRFPCPAKLLFSNLLDLSFLCRSRAAAPVGDEVL